MHEYREANKHCNEIYKYDLYQIYYLQKGTHECPGTRTLEVLTIASTQFHTKSITYKSMLHYHYFVHRLKKFCLVI